MSRPPPADPARVEATIEAVLGHPDFEAARQPPGTEVQALGELFDAALRAVEALLGDLRARHPGLFLALVLIALGVVVALGAWGARRYRRLGRVSTGDGPSRRGPPGPEARLAEARRAAAAGAHHDAIRLLFLAATAAREGDESAARARTYRESSQALGTEAGGAASELLARVEAGVYGGRPLGAEDWAEAERLLAPLIERAP